MRSSAFRRGLILLACVVMLGGCSSVAKQNYLRHLSTTIPPSRRNVETITLTARTPDPGVVVVTSPNRPKQ